jgi:hypothetical protein
MDRKKDDPDRLPGPPSTAISTNAREGSASGRGVSPATGSRMTFEFPTLTNVQEIVSSPNPAALITQHVELRGVRVQRVLSSQYVIVGQAEGKGIVVRLQELIPDVKPGQSLNITGIVAQLGEDLSHWELDPASKQLLSGQSIFINANQSGRANAGQQTP